MVLPKLSLSRRSYHRGPRFKDQCHVFDCSVFLTTPCCIVYVMYHGQLDIIFAFDHSGCGFRELGLKIPNTRRIPDKHVTSSSERDSGHSAHRGRIGIEVMGTWDDGWCSSQTDTTPYMQVFFGAYMYFIPSDQENVLNKEMMDVRNF